ncbi:F0F1 ATP synthase subunit [Methylocystis heyeri]|uniref:F0F1 ATP synthase subunit n=2 Tax=Methylocystis heyeri TaxID=391905 RepID=A0A6B8KBH8_9HYPH|nr:F0F1 ATP synthase subunit [Methylocystis heyeri]
MAAEKPEKPMRPQPSLAEEVGAKASRKLKARRKGPHGVWYGLGMMGLIGWSVATPTVLGAALGLWLDRRYPSPHSWTLTLLIVGLILGCLSAWRWVAEEEKRIRDDQDDGR